MELKKIMIDTDVGDDIDDAYALIFASLLQELKLIGVVTTYRNAPMRAKIVQALLADYGKYIPVYAGEDDPVCEPYHNFRHEVFRNGKPMIMQYEPDMARFPVRPGGVQFMTEQLRRYPNQITLIAIGPLTDIAKMFREAPDTMGLIREMYIMGGNFGEERAEWNIKCDPEAAAQVFSAPVPKKVIGWEITSQTVMDEAMWSYFQDLAGKSERLIRLSKLWLRCNDYRNLPIMHDALTVGCAAEDFCRFTRAGVRVELDGENRGVTYCEEDANGWTEVAVRVDLPKFFGRLRQSFSTANAENYEKGVSL